MKTPKFYNFDKKSENNKFIHAFTAGNACYFLKFGNIHKQRIA